MKYTGLRDWIEQVKAVGQMESVRRAHWDLEIGGLTELICKRFKPPPALLFDDIPDYPSGHRVLANMLDSVERLAITTGIDPQITPVEFIHKWREKIKGLSPIPPAVVKDGPVLENIRTEAQVNLFEFPAPKWHEQDGGRYLGTANLVITRDPEEGWVNLGTYRVMVQNENTVSVYISPGKQGRIQRQKYFDMSRPCPVAIVFGQDPLLFVTASTDVPYGMSEYEYAGGIREEPISVIEGPVTGLPIPASAEIAIEGEMTPGDVMPEGPFGEWTGYYASARRSEPVLRVKSVLFRNQPIICGAPPMRPSVGQGFYRSLERSALIWNALEDAGVPDVTAVYSHPAAGRFLTIVAIRQRYPGHAKQAALVASQCRAGAYLGRYVIVVDDDVDIYDSEEVLWAMCTRSDPERSIDILRRCWSGPLDPAIRREEKGFNSRAIIDATRPYEWKDQFPPVSGISSDLKDQLEGKWSHLLAGLARVAKKP